MSTLYNFEITEDGSFQFTTDRGVVYLVYFLETIVPDREGNMHTFLNLGFIRDGSHECVPFANKFDSKIQATIVHVIKDIFEKHDHRVLIYFCFGDDGYARHRRITFNKWKAGLSESIESHDATIQYDEHEVFSCLMLYKYNPLRTLILGAFEAYLDDFRV